MTADAHLDPPPPCGEMLSHVRFRALMFVFQQDPKVQGQTWPLKVASLDSKETMFVISIFSPVSSCAASQALVTPAWRSHGTGDRYAHPPPPPTPRPPPPLPPRGLPLPPAGGMPGTESTFLPKRVPSSLLHLPNFSGLCAYPFLIEPSLLQLGVLQKEEAFSDSVLMECSCRILAPEYCAELVKSRKTHHIGLPYKLQPKGFALPPWHLQQRLHLRQMHSL